MASTSSVNDSPTTIPVHKFKSFLKRIEVKSPHHSTPTSSWSNYDVICLPPSRRTWGHLDFFAFWNVQAFSIATWQTATLITTLGITVWQAMLCVFVARLIIAAVALSHGWGGSVWHVGFPIYSRFTFGYRGSYICLIQRIVLCIIWYSTQSYTCGILLSVMLSALSPTFHNLKNTIPLHVHLTTKELIGWIIYHIVSLPFLFIPPEKFNIPFKFITFCAFLAIFGTSIGLLVHIGGLKNLAVLKYARNPRKSYKKLGWNLIFGVNTVINTFVVGLTNQPDFSRFARKPGVQIWGQSISIIVFSSVVPLMAIMATYANMQAFPISATSSNIWNPPYLIESWIDTDYSPRTRCAAFFSALGFFISTAGLNIIDNGVSGGIDLVAISPRYINIRRGTLIIMLISMAIQPWYILSEAPVFLNVLGSYGCFFGPMIGVFTSEYYLVRKQKLKLSELFNGSKDSIYWFWHGFNLRAIISWICGFIPGVTGIASLNSNATSVSKISVKLFHTPFVLGYLIAFFLNTILNYFFKPPGIGEIDEYDIFGTFTEKEALKMGVKPKEEMPDTSPTVEVFSIHEMPNSPEKNLDECTYWQ
ncbi:hypothetical protein WICPIJ_000397 [Wickerhamomyces pijperi]|uniref:Allantoin permease n=1 Tax=Wickerhamomyces pijperi TaxID=599730 RepID=A0A9P8TQW4_WICPI|nr:hypothetical protein WICPIJ_000397 [Wickerhamomyces pijperi]